MVISQQPDKSIDTMITIIADENIANLDDYLVHHDIRLIKMKGRCINQVALDEHQPDALFVRSVTPINPQTISDFGKIRFIGSATIGTDHIDIDYLHRKGICFANAQGSSKHSVAQYVICAILHLRSHSIDTPTTLGIIGLGNIGSTLAKYVQDLGWQVLGYDPYLPKSQLNNSELYELLAQSDIVSIHTPLTHTGDYPTHQLFDKTVLSHLKSHAILINTARGEIINQADLLLTIADKKLRTALDVFPYEPSIDAVLLNQISLATPHIAGYTIEGKMRGTDMIYQDFCKAFDLPIIQNLEALLPPNCYHWANFKKSVTQDSQSTLRYFYDIYKDDQSLRAVNKDGVSAQDFDALRKHYALRHEWQY